MDANIVDDYVKFSLQNQPIITSCKYLLYTQGDISCKPVCSEKLNEYSGNGIVTLGANVSSVILNLKIKQGCSYQLLFENFLACTRGIKLIVCETSKYCTLQNLSNEIQYIWIVAFGKYEKITIKDDENITLTKDILLIFDNKLKFIESENFYKITGPCTFYIQTKFKDGECGSKISLWNILNNARNDKKLRDKLRNI
jgi:hypothetical protein